MDPARDARTAVSREWRDRVPRLRDTVEGHGNTIRFCRLPDCRSDLRLATRAADRRRNRRSAHVHGAPDLRCIYGALDESTATGRVLRRVLSNLPGGVRIRVEPAGIPVDGNLGREQEPVAPAMEWRDGDARNGIWRVAVSGIAPCDDRARTIVRRTRVPMDSGTDAARGRILDRLPCGEPGSGTSEPTEISHGKTRKNTAERRRGKTRMNTGTTHPAFSATFARKAVALPWPRNTYPGLCQVCRDRKLNLGSRRIFRKIF